MIQTMLTHYRRRRREFEMSWEEGGWFVIWDVPPGKPGAISGVGDEFEEPVGGGGGQQGGIEDVEDTAEAGEVAGVFDAGVAFEEGFEEIAELADGAEHQAREEALCEVVGVEVGGERPAQESREDQAAEESFGGLAGGKPGDEFVFSD